MPLNPRPVVISDPLWPKWLSEFPTPPGKELAKARRYHRQVNSHLDVMPPPSLLSPTEIDRLVAWLENYLSRLRANMRIDVDLGLAGTATGLGSAAAIAIFGDMALTFGTVTAIILAIGSAKAYNLKRTLDYVGEIEARIELLIDTL